MRAVLILALSVVLAAGCSIGGDTVELSQKDSGRTVEVAVGDTIVVSLESNPTTGFSWSPVQGTPTGGVIDLVSKTYEREGDAAGAGGVETWKYEAVKAGSTKLDLEYVRPFEPDQPAGKFTVAVKVVKG
jgi:inhibitor of cysteine peptidase